MFGDIVDVCVFFLQAEDGIRDLVRSRGLGDVYKRQALPGQIERPLLRRATSDQQGIADTPRPYLPRPLSLSLIHI